MPSIVLYCSLAVGVLSVLTVAPFARMFYVEATIHSSHLIRGRIPTPCYIVGGCLGAALLFDIVGAYFSRSNKLTSHICGAFVLALVMISSWISGLRVVGSYEFVSKNQKKLSALHQNAVELRATVVSDNLRLALEKRKKTQPPTVGSALHSKSPSGSSQDSQSEVVIKVSTAESSAADARDRGTSALQRLKRAATGAAAASRKRESKLVADESSRRKALAEERRKRSRKQRIAGVYSLASCVALLHAVGFYIVMRSRVWYLYALAYVLMSPLVIIPLLAGIDCCKPHSDLLGRLALDLWELSDASREILLQYCANLTLAALFTINVAVFQWSIPIFSLILYLASLAFGLSLFAYPVYLTWEFRKRVFAAVRSGRKVGRAGRSVPFETALGSGAPDSERTRKMQIIRTKLNIGNAGDGDVSLYKYLNSESTFEFDLLGHHLSEVFALENLLFLSHAIIFRQLVLDLYSQIESAGAWRVVDTHYPRGKRHIFKEIHLRYLSPIREHFKSFVQGINQEDDGGYDHVTPGGPSQKGKKKKKHKQRSADSTVPLSEDSSSSSSSVGADSGIERVKAGVDIRPYRDIAYSIFDTFVKDGAESEINIPSRMRADLKLFFDQRYFEHALEIAKLREGELERRKAQRAAAAKAKAAASQGLATAAGDAGSGMLRVKHMPKSSSMFGNLPAHSAGALEEDKMTNFKQEKGRHEEVELCQRYLEVFNSAICEVYSLLNAILRSDFPRWAENEMRKMTLSSSLSGDGGRPKRGLFGRSKRVRARSNF